LLKIESLRRPQMGGAFTSANPGLKPAHSPDFKPVSSSLCC
jgi:hypothetical protein